MKNENNSLVLLTFGGAEKSIFEMNAEEFKKAAISIRHRAKEKAFSKGLPIYYTHHNNNSDVIAEYPDGHIEIVEF